MHAIVAIKNKYMKQIFTILCILISTLGFSQDYNFIPKWNKGNVRQITFTHHESIYEDGVLIFDTTYFNNGSIKVIEDNADNYVLEIVYENQALRAVQEFYDKLDEELKEFKTL